jgi:hypothetical protein
MIFHKNSEPVSETPLVNDNNSVMDMTLYVKVCKSTFNKWKTVRIDHLGLDWGVKGFVGDA